MELAKNSDTYQKHKKLSDTIYISSLLGVMITFIVLSYKQTGAEIIEGNLDVKAQSTITVCQYSLPGKEMDNSVSAHNNGEVPACVFLEIQMPHEPMMINRKTNEIVDMPLFDYSYVQNDITSEYNFDKWTDITDEIYGEDYDGFSYVYAYTGGTGSMIPLESGGATECIYNKVKLSKYYNFNSKDEDTQILNVEILAHACLFSLSDGKTPVEVWDTYIK